MSRVRYGPSRISSASLVGALTIVACAGTAIWWGVLLSAPKPAIAPAVEPALNQPDPAAALALFGTVGRVNASAPDARLGAIRVVGVIVHPKLGAALLSVNGAPPKAYAVGENVSPGLNLREVNADGAVFDRFGERIEVAAPRRTSVELLNRNAPQP
jgi:general secretion pathway protein C